MNNTLPPFPDDITAVRWYWHNSDSFVPYELSININLEKQYQRLRQLQNPSPDDMRLVIDNERYGDFSFKSELDIKRHFRGLDDETGLVGLQRRHDDPTKRRAIKRDERMFAGCEFVLITPDLDDKSRALIKAAINTGAVLVSTQAARWNYNTVALAPVDFTGPLTDLRIPREQPIISIAWILRSIMAGNRMSLTPNFVLPIHVVSSPSAAPRSLSSTPIPPAASGKRPPSPDQNSSTSAAQPLLAPEKRQRTEMTDLSSPSSAALHLVVGSQLAGVCLKTDGALVDLDEPSLHCALVFTGVAAATETNAQQRQVSGLITWSEDDVIKHQTLFSGSIESDGKKRTIRIQETERVAGAGTLRSFEGRLNARDCRLFSTDRNLQVVLLPVSGDRSLLLGSISVPALLFITQHTSPSSFRGLLVASEIGGSTTQVSGTLTNETLRFDGADLHADLSAVAASTFEGTLKRPNRAQLMIRLQLAAG